MNKAFAINHSATHIKVVCRVLIALYCLIVLMPFVEKVTVGIATIFKMMILACILIVLGSLTCSFWLLYSYLKFDKTTQVYINTDSQTFRYVRNGFDLQFPLKDITSVVIVTPYLKAIDEQYYKIYIKEREIPLIVTDVVCGYLNFLLNKPCEVLFTHQQLTIPKDRYEELLQIYYIEKEEIVPQS